MGKQRLFLSHRLDRLLDHLAENLLQEKCPLLSERWILLPGAINRQTFSIALAERMPNQAIAGIKMIGWREALLSACKGKRIADRFELSLLISKSLNSSDELSTWLFGKEARKASLVRSLSRQMQEAGFEKMHLEKGWQQELFEKIAVEGPWRFPFQLFEEISFPKEVASIHCLGLDELPSEVWDFLLNKEPLSIYLFSPCKMFWEDICTDKERSFLAKKGGEALEELLRDTHPLLASWGRVGRNTMRTLSVKPLDTIESYEGSEEDWAVAQEQFTSGRSSLLQMLRHDLLFLRTLQDSPATPLEAPDDSLEIAAAGASKLREVQVLKEKILEFLHQTKADCQDLLVLAPDMKEYESLIHYVFGQDLPYRLSCTTPQNPYNEALQLFFRLKDNGWEVDDLLELLENSAFQEKWGFNQSDLKQFRTWIDEAQVRGSFGSRRNDWQEGLKRMLLGLVYLLKEEEGPLRIRSVDFGQAERLDLFFEMISSLQEEAKRLERSQDLEKWGATLKEVCEKLFLSKGSEADLFEKFLEKVRRAAPYFPKEEFSFSLLRAEFDAMCRAESAAWQESFVSAVQCSSLQPGAIRPARAIFILGLDREHFFCRKSRSSLDWGTSEKDPLQEGRYLLLQALFMAEQRLYLSYNSICAADGTAQELALPIQELLETLQMFYPLKNGSYTKSYPVTDFRSAKKEVRSFSIPEKETRRVFELSDLCLLARNPWQYFMKRGLGVYLEEEELFLQKRLKDFKLPWRIEQRLLRSEQPVSQVQIDQFPPGRFGELSILQLAEKSRAWEGHFRKWGIEKEELFTISFSKECQEKTAFCAPALKIPDLNVEIVGELEFVSAKGLVRPAGEKSFAKLRHWPEALMHAAFFETSEVFLYLLDGRQTSWCNIDPLLGLRRWVEYALIAEKTPSPFIEPWAKEFFKQDREKWFEKALSPIYRENPSFRWMLDRMQPLKLEEIWEKWGSYLQTHLPEVVDEGV